MDDTTRQNFLDELCPRLRPLIECVMDCDCGCEVVDFFRHRMLAWIEAKDIACHVQRPLEQVVQSLDRLVEMRIAERTVILDWVFYGLTRDIQILNALEQFWLMRDDWHTQLERVRDTLRLHATTPLDAAFITPFGLPQNTPNGAIKPAVFGLD